MLDGELFPVLDNLGCQFRLNSLFFVSFWHSFCHIIGQREWSVKGNYLYL